MSALGGKRTLAAVDPQSIFTWRCVREAVDAVSCVRSLTSQAQTGWDIDSKGQIDMTNSTSTSMAIIFGLAVFVLILTVGWRSVQNRRILRLQGANGQETIIVANEDDEISSIVTTSMENAQPEPAPAPAPAPSVVVVHTGAADSASAPQFGKSAAKHEAAVSDFTR